MPKLKESPAHCADPQCQALKPEESGSGDVVFRDV